MLGILLIGVAIVVGVAMFKANAVESSRMAIINDLGFYAMRGRQIYLRPTNLGGTNKDFSGITIEQLAPVTQNENGRYYIESTTKNEMILIGVGKIVVHQDTVRIRMRVNEAQNKIEIIN